MNELPSWGFYSGSTFHIRYKPKLHKFRYPYFCFWLNLDRLNDVKEAQPSWFRASSGLLRFRRENHMGHPECNLADYVRGVAGLDSSPENQVFYLGQLTYLSRYFSPVNFYFIGNSESEDGHYFHTLVAEVSNTPWEEMHHYVIPLNKTVISNNNFEHEKQFHVSPFMTVEQNYRWKIQLPNNTQNRFNITIQSFDDSGDLFSASMNLKAAPLNRSSLISVIISNLVFFGSTKARIYWQALKLWSKGIRYQTYPGPTGNEIKKTTH